MAMCWAGNLVEARAKLPEFQLLGNRSPSLSLRATSHALITCKLCIQSRYNILFDNRVVIP